MDYFYQDDFVTLYHGDNRDVVPCLDTGKIDLLLTDPPYGVGWEIHDRYAPRFDLHGGDLLNKPWRDMEGDAEPFDPAPWMAYPKAILWGANCYSDRLPMGRWLIWDKRYKSGKSFKLSDGEVAWMKGGHGIRIYAQTWQGIARSTNHPAERLGHVTPVFHPAQKPIRLGLFCIELAGKSVKTLLDPFCGSGSFLCAAKELGLKAWGIEIEEKYAETAARRLEMTCVQERLTDGNGNRL